MSSSTLPSPAPAHAGTEPVAPGPPDHDEPAAARPAPTGGAPERRRWARRAGVLALLAGTAVLYLWGLSASGYGNSFYSAAVQAGSQSWKAFFFGSLDAGNAITVDKPPAALWLMALSVRLFGLSSWSILAPQALLGVATVGVLYASVRRTSGHVAGLLAGTLLALTPAAALMFRFNNPDALLVFLLTCATYVTLRAAEKASGKTLAWAGVLVGFAFLTKMLQAFLVLPAFVLVYLVAAPTPLRKRIGHLLGAFAAMVVALGWWVAVVELVPESWRPYVGGSEDDSVLNLVFGYNGLGRILGEGSGNGGGGAGFGGTPGLTRLFDQVSAGMITWLLPAALLLAAGALVALRHAPRTDTRRAAVVVWTGSTLVTALTFSFMEGTYHDYYVVALAPSIAAGVVVAGAVLWAGRSRWWSRAVLALTSAVTALWAFVLLGRASGVYETLRWPVLVAGALAALGLLLVFRLRRLAAAAVLALAFAAAATGPTAYTLDTVATPHTGSIVTAGPVSGNGFGGPGQDRGTRPDGTRGQGFPGGQPPTGGQAPTQGQAPGGSTPADGGRTPAGGGGTEGGAASTELVTLLQADGGTYRWVAASTGSQSAATYQLASEQPVMAIGGFNGGDPSPTLEQFQAYVAAGDIHYYLAGGQGGGRGGGTGSASEIATWVSEHYTATTVGSTTVYDLTAPTG